MHIVVYGILPRSSLKIKAHACWLSVRLAPGPALHVSGLPDNVNLPRKGVPAVQGSKDLLPAEPLVLRLAGQGVEDERQAAGGGVVALKHEGVHLRSQIFVRQALLILILEVGQQTEMHQRMSRLSKMQMVVRNGIDV